MSASETLELINRIAKVFKDYCGVLTEESIRKNFILLYELLDEMMDFGYPQSTSTEVLKNCIHNEPIVVSAPTSTTSAVLSAINNRTKPSGSANIPMGLSTARGGKHKNEIFVVNLIFYAPVNFLYYLLLNN